MGEVADQYLEGMGSEAQREATRRLQTIPVGHTFFLTWASIQARSLLLDQ
jgi:hypothetical protein